MAIPTFPHFVDTCYVSHISEIIRIHQEGRISARRQPINARRQFARKIVLLSWRFFLAPGVNHLISVDESEICIWDSGDSKLRG